MKRALPLLLVTTVIAGCISIRGTIVRSDSAEHLGYLRHAVLFRFKPEATPDQIRAVENAFRNLPNQIDSIHAFEWGVEISGRSLNKGFTHGGLFTFEDEAARDAYIAHPAHQDFAALVRPLVEELFVFDYWAQN